MTRRIFKSSIFVLVAMVFSIGFAGLSDSPVSALNKSCQGFDCVTKNNTTFNKKTGNTETVNSFAGTITNTVLYFVGGVSIIMIIYGGILYTISSGDTTKTKKARDTILYAVIGLVVALLSLAIVNFVINPASTVGTPTTSKSGATPTP